MFCDLLARARRARAVFTPGRRDVAADAVHAEQPEREQHAVAQVRDGEDVLQAVFHGCNPRTLARLLRDRLRRAAGRRDLLRRLAAELVRAHRQRLRRPRRAPAP